MNELQKIVVLCVIIGVVVLGFLFFMNLDLYDVLHQEEEIESIDDSRNPSEPVDSEPVVVNPPTNGTDPTSHKTIGVFGCSNTAQHAQGYEAVSSKNKLWTSSGLSLGGGTVGKLYELIAGNRGHWRVFDTFNDNYPPDAVWLQLCIQEGQGIDSGITNAQKEELKGVIENINLKTGAVPIYISPLNLYAEPSICKITGDVGVPDSIELVNWAVSQDLAFRGPITGPLTVEMLREDKCHINHKTGGIFVGQQLVDFFD